MMTKRILFYLLFTLPLYLHAQHAFEIKVDYSMQVQNSEQYAVSGSVLSGKIESNKTYYLDDGTNSRLHVVVFTAQPIGQYGRYIDLSSNVM